VSVPPSTPVERRPAPRPVLMALVTLVVGVGLAAGCVSQTGPAARSLTLVNEARRSNGMGALSLDGALQRKAQDWSVHMASTGKLVHSDLRAGLPAGWCSAGENIAYAHGDADQIHRMWMNSSGHRANILNSQFTHIGIGAHRDSQGRLWMTQVFIKRC
jgi:uncharacterized protein YkwD